MKQSLQLSLRQQLKMTQQLQQAIRLLQLSSLELRTEIQTLLESNMVLEQVDEVSGSLERSVSESSEPVESEFESTALSADAPADELPVEGDWDDAYENYDGATSFSQPDDDERDRFENRTSSYESLQDYLLWQLRLTPFSETDTLIAYAIIDAVDERGYLTASLEDIQQSLRDPTVDLDDIQVVLRRIQRFDPPGVAARDPGECLLLQLEQLPATTSWLSEAKELVRNHLTLLADRDFNGLMRRLKVTKTELQAIIDRIRSLNPYPGASVSTAQAQYIIPDVFVYRVKTTDESANHNAEMEEDNRPVDSPWRVVLNPDNLPRLRIKSEYARLLRRADTSAANVNLRTHLQEARWFLTSLQKRNRTLLKVARCIVEEQREFFEGGEEKMKPLVLREVAEKVEMHESTISRVTTQKYMHTPRGIFEFKYFFSSHVENGEGEGHSSTAIRAMMKRLIAHEDPCNPLSDFKIAKLLSETAGITVARRTVAKYRELLSIPSSTDRKRLA